MSFLSSQFIKKTILGLGCSVVALAVDAGLLFSLTEWAGYSYLVAAAIGFSAGFVVNYLISKYWVFDDQSQRAEKVTLALFFLVGIMGLLINQLILYIGVEKLGLYVMFAKALSAGIVFWFNFLIRGYFIFKDPDLCKKNKKKL